MPTSRRSVKADAEVSDATAVIPLNAVVETAPVPDDAVIREAPAQGSKLPVPAQFPLVAALSFAMANLGYVVLDEASKGQLAAVSRAPETRVEYGVLIAWRIIELALGWFGNLDSWDIASLNVIAHGPSLYLLTTFYSLNPVVAVSALAIETLSAFVPFLLLRPLSAVHRPETKLPNKELVDWGMHLYTAGLSGSIYTVIVTVFLRIMPGFLVVHFSSLPTLAPAYDASYTDIIPVALVFGLAASNFIFAPFATTGKVKEDEAIREFDPAVATLGETVRWNLCGYTAKTKVGVGRTAIAAAATAVNVYVACTLTINGVDPLGAVGYAAVWVSAVILSGVGLGFVGGD